MHGKPFARYAGYRNAARNGEIALTDTEVTESKVFHPKPSWGWIWPLVVAAVAVAPLFAAWFDPAAHEDLTALWIILAIIVPLAIYMLMTVFAFPTMRYELTANSLDLVYWPLRYRVPYEHIKRVAREDLVPSLWSSMRFPGLAVGKVPYMGRRPITMCSTRAAKGVIVVSTADSDYGVSPAEEDAFISALLARLPAAE